MSQIVNRLGKYLKHKKISVRQAEISIGMSTGALNTAIKHGRDIQSKWIVRALECYNDLNLPWLIVGHGEMLKGYPENDVVNLSKEDKPSYTGELNDLRIANKFLKEKIESFTEIMDLQKSLIDELRNKDKSKN